MSRFLSQKYKDLTPYIPGEQPQDVEYIKLNTNESPFPPCQGVIDALNADEAKNLRLYSDPNATQSTDAIAKYYDVKPYEILVSNGSDEILAFIYMAFCDAENVMAYPDISYGFYPVFSELINIKKEIIPLNDDFTINVDAFLGINKNIIIANPNAPTGIEISQDDIRKIAKTNPNNIVVIDEAYVDFGADTAIPLIREFDNLIIVQTFSKSRALAGARLGFAVSNAEIIKDLKKIKFSFNPYNVNRLSDKIGKLAMEDTKYFGNCRNKIIKNREFTTRKLKKLGFNILPSKANFIFVSHNKFNGENYYNYLKNNGILVRYFGLPRLNKFVRITIGTKEQMEILIEKTKIFLKEF